MYQTGRTGKPFNYNYRQAYSEFGTGWPAPPIYFSGTCDLNETGSALKSGSGRNDILKTGPGCVSRFPVAKLKLPEWFPLMTRNSPNPSICTPARGWQKVCSAISDNIVFNTARLLFFDKPVAFAICSVNCVLFMWLGNSLNIFLPSENYLHADHEGSLDIAIASDKQPKIICCFHTKILNSSLLSILGATGDFHKIFWFKDTFTPPTIAA